MRTGELCGHCTILAAALRKQANHSCGGRHCARQGWHSMWALSPAVAGCRQTARPRHAMSQLYHGAGPRGTIVCQSLAAWPVAELSVALGRGAGAGPGLCAGGVPAGGRRPGPDQRQPQRRHQPPAGAPPRLCTLLAQRGKARQSSGPHAGALHGLRSIIIGAE